ncbi:hypothetical protein [Leisingera aquaemixtae]|uniref:hypothetical protein n=1 Tax=Leisingera aquaemixtae TaxID=1396826 RepID=UPI0021A35E33|nr:hypothetical protein [Leisingera aquaemixtae]UWQ47201.1 hypothetical protein K3719_07510 [Leisingera aquaemixtae]
MFDFHQDALKDLRDFMSSHHEALQNASFLLGGQPALRRTQALLDDITGERRLTGRLKRGIVKLHDLLTLSNVHEFETLEAACFAEIDPASPIVEELCLLADALKEAIHRHQDIDLIELIETDLTA